MGPRLKKKKDIFATARMVMEVASIEVQAAFIRVVGDWGTTEKWLVKETRPIGPLQLAIAASSRTGRWIDQLPKTCKSS